MAKELEDIEEIPVGLPSIQEEIKEEGAKPPEVVAPPSDAPSDVPAALPKEEPRRGRGRPAGSKNKAPAAMRKPKEVSVVEAPAAEEPVRKPSPPRAIPLPTIRPSDELFSLLLQQQNKKQMHKKALYASWFR